MRDRMDSDRHQPIIVKIKGSTAQGTRRDTDRDRDRGRRGRKRGRESRRLMDRDLILDSRE